MSCSHPLIAIDKGKLPNGKKNIKVISRIDDVNSIEQARFKYEHFNHRLLLLPCGKCPGCLKARRKEWAIRCEGEAKYYVDNCFVTLTYDDQFLPQEPQKEHYRNFIKDLRNHGIKVRYFGCSERGSKTRRLHWHLILFGWIPDDLRKSHKSDSGFWCYTSRFLSDIWQKGLVVVSEFTSETAAYVAGYVDKKLDNPEDDSFVFMSTHPGIGRRYIEENLDKFYDYDVIVTKFGNHKAGVPRYFDKVAESQGLVLNSIRDKRARCADASRAQEMRQLGCIDYNSYLAKVFDKEVGAMRSRKRGL